MSLHGLFKIHKGFRKAKLVCEFFAALAKLSQSYFWFAKFLQSAFEVAKFSQGGYGVAKFSQGGFGVAKFSQGGFGVMKFSHALRIAIFFLLHKKFEKFFHLFWNSLAIDQKLN